MLVLIFLGLIFTLIALAFDLRKKRIPDYFQIIAAASGLLVSLTISFTYFLSSLAFGGFFLLIGFFVSIFGGWGGGDGKFMGALGTFFHPVSLYFLLSLIASTMWFKISLILTGKDPGKIPREEWPEKGVPFTPAFLLTEILVLLVVLIF